VVALTTQTKSDTKQDLKQSMQSSANPVVIAEDDYARGPVFSSGADQPSALSVRRTRISAADPEVSLSWGAHPGYVVRLYLAAADGCTIIQDKKVVPVPPRRALETSFRGVTEPCLWPVACPVDHIRFELPQRALAQWMESHQHAKRGWLDLRSGSSVMDKTLVAFGRAALAAIEEPDKTSQFFIDHILSGVCAYMFEAFSSPPKRPPSGGLAAWQERRAKGLMESRVGADLSLEELARECGLSVAHFARAFRQSVGETPHRWLMRRRIETAQRLLVETDKRLTAIAGECGFADQAHLTNVFKGLIGVPPGAFRREKNALKQRHENPASSYRNLDRSAH
jgi:AraC family transcriptional regulator